MVEQKREDSRMTLGFPAGAGEPRERKGRNDSTGEAKSLVPLHSKKRSPLLGELPLGSCWGLPVVHTPLQ